MTADRPWLVIGAGYAAIPVVAALRGAGVPVRVVDRGAGPGGLWARGVYPGVRLITSRRSTGYAGRPLPGDPGGFPSAAEMADYLADAAAAAGVAAVLSAGTAAAEVQPLGDGGWRALLHGPDGPEELVADAVVVASGQHSAPLVPALAGTLTVPAVHAADWRGELVGPGRTVLVVGAGNSGCDIAVQAADAGSTTLLAARAGPHLLPRTLWGRVTADLQAPPLPSWLVRPAASVALRLSLDAPAAWPAPTTSWFDAVPVIHSEIGDRLRRDRVRLCAEPVAAEGDAVTLADGAVVRVDALIWATGYHRALPVGRTLVDGGADPAPLQLVAGSVSPVTPGLFLAGMVTPRGGAGALLSDVGATLAALAPAYRAAAPEQRAAWPRLLARFVTPRSVYNVELRDAHRDLRQLRAALPSLRRLTDRGDVA